MKPPKNLCSVLALALAIGSSACAADKTLMDYFLPMPIHGVLSSNAWGAPNVLPRDPQNGLEDVTLKHWCYWDGKIIQAQDGKYHMFASRWDQGLGHGGWGTSKAVHAVSDNPTGPYLDQGLCWPDNQGGKGHNVIALVLPDGRYDVVVSETRSGDVFVSSSLNGPWEYLGAIKVAPNAYSSLASWSNVSVLVRPEGGFMIVARSGAVWISQTGILGPYTIQGPSLFNGLPGLPTHDLEDPVLWYSGDLYHLVVNCWSQHQAFHLTSPDGIHHWVNRGLAYDNSRNFLRYSDGTVNHWTIVGRPSVFLENGHVAYFTFAVIDVPKNQELPNDNHGSKVIVVPFDGAALDRDLQNPPIFDDPAIPAGQPARLP